MKQILSFIYVTLIIQTTYEDCLEDITLTTLFGSAKAAPSQNTELCTGLFNIGKGACVDGKDVKIKLEEANAELNEAIAPLEDFQDTLNAYLDYVLYIVNTKENLTEEEKEHNDEAKHIIEEQRVFYKEQFEVNKQTCFDAYAILQQGFLCYTASEKASMKTVVTDDQMIVLVDHKNLHSLDSCFYIFAAMCVMAKPVNTLFANNSKFASLNEEFDKRCNSYYTNEDCIGRS